VKIKGNLPPGWKNNKLGSLCTKLTDGTHKTPDYKTSGVVFISAKNVRNGQLDFNDHKYISDEEHEFLTKRCKPEAGDVMLSKSGSLGDAVVVPKLDFEFSIFESLALIKVKKMQISPNYLMQILNSPLAKRYFWSITTGLAVKHLHLGDLKKMPILYPSLLEQNAITDLLSTWDEAIEKTEQLIQAKEANLKGQVQKLISWQCDSWPHIKPKKIFDTITEKNFPEEELLSVTQDRGVIPRSMLEGRVMSPDGTTANYKLIKQGDFAISLRSFQGGIEYSNYQGLISPAYTVLRPKIELNNDFYRLFFKSYIFIKKYLNLAVIGIRDGKQVSIPDFMSIKIPVPPLEEQKKIAETLSIYQHEIDLLKQLADKYKTQKRGLMQKMLTGEWRVKSEIVKRFKEEK
jgi:type I restriction enzyme S subunit